MNRGLAPLIHEPYKRQLKTKRIAVLKVLRELTAKMKGVRSTLTPDSTNLPCHVEITRESPIQVGYRNFDDFSIGTGLDGNPKTVGYILGKFKDSTAVCYSPGNMVLLKESHKVLANHFENYLHQVSPLDVCTSFSDGGHWRRFIVRSNDVEDLMGIAILHPQNLSKNELEEEKNRLRNFFQPLAQDISLKSLYFQTCRGTRCTHEESNFQYVMGHEYLRENINGMSIRVSPYSFSYVNKKVAEVLYNVVLEEIDPQPGINVIELNCDGGVMTCQIAPKVAKAIGIDPSPSGICDAKFNAKINQLLNCEFFDGDLESCLDKLIEEHYSENLALIINAGSKGVTAGLINTIRKMSNIQRLIYITKNPGGGPLKNFAHLCLPFRPKDRIEGDPFIPLRATPIDMYPQTEKYELVMTFVRS
ncbi:tRNA (uracil-5-)-methyltransferase homolog B-like [Brevipalpus obovatus]|uniref:tRNA (uracil-5-)-methyltransferase homolog B-like n=1 Tax=Brevipalpus obovatus TaxID=246614 RepID=UPI003D9E3814